MLQIFTEVSRLAVPLLFLTVITQGMRRGTAVYEVFVSGAKNGLRTTARLVPNLLAMLVAIQVFRLSGALDLVLAALRPLASLFAVPEEVLPLMLVRPLSGSASLGILAQLYAEYGPDSLIGRMASAVMGTTETTFYVLTVYTGAVGIQRIRHALTASLIADLVGFAAAVFITLVVFR